MMLFSQLLDKEILSIQNGEHIGYLDDVEIDAETYQVTSLVSYGKSKALGLLGRETDIKIPIACVRVVGVDSVLVEGSFKTSTKTERNRSILHQIFP